MPRLVVLLALSVCVFGCAGEPQRYAWNRTHPHLCPNARGLTDSDIDEIARVVARATPQIIMAISAPRHSLQKLEITTCYPGATEQESPDRSLFGHCTLEKIGGTWKVTYVGTNLDPAIAFMTACMEPVQQTPRAAVEKKVGRGN